MNASRRILTLCATLLPTFTFLYSQGPPDVVTRWGVHAGGNYNLTGVGYGNWINDPNRPGGQFTALVNNDGDGFGPYGGLNVQTSLSDLIHLGARVSYDNRNVVAYDDKSYQKPGTILASTAATYFKDEYSFKNTYVNVEPFIKFYLGKNFHITGGLGLAYALTNKFDYTPEASTKQTDLNVAKGDSLTHKFCGSGFAGVGYDFYLADAKNSNQWILTPYVESSYMVSQRGVDYKSQNAFIDALSTVSIRAGLSLAFGTADIVEERVSAEPTRPAYVPPPTPGKLFRMVDPSNGVYAKRIERSEFPIRPYVFFDKGSNEIPNRYNKLTRSQIRDYITRSGVTADDVAEVDERPKIQRDVYYNILNVMGSRLTSIPGSSVELYASDPSGKDPRPYAESVKRYLVDVWGVSPDQITISTGDPEPRSGTTRASASDVPALADENRRVQFRNMKPDRLGARVPIASVRQAELDHQVYVDINTMTNITEWRATLEGDGMSRTYGPFKGSTAYLDPTGLLSSDQRSQKFNLKIDATQRDGSVRTETEPITLVRTDQEGISTRHRLLFEFDEEDPVARSKSFLISNIIPTVRDNSHVYIYGYTDSVGRNNLELAMKRSDQVMGIMKDQLNAWGVKNVHFTSAALGEDEPLFANNLPEGRMYNRTVVIDIVP